MPSLPDQPSTPPGVQRTARPARLDRRRVVLYTPSRVGLTGVRRAGPGRRQLHVDLSPPDAPYWVRYRLTGSPARAQHTADITLSPTDNGGTDLHWRATPTRHLPGTARRRTAALEAAVAGLAAQLASAAEDPATTRAEWAHARHDVAAAPLRSLTAVPAGDAVAA